MELPIAHAFLQMRRDARRCYSAREALPGHGRHAPDVERLIMKSVPDGTTRPTMLTYGATDLAYFLDGPEAEAAKRDPPLELVATRHASILWVEFSDQRDPKSLSHDNASADGGELCAGS